MKKFFTFVLGALICMFGADAAVRIEKTQNRTKTAQITTNDKPSRTISTTNKINKSRSAQKTYILGQKNTESNERQRTLTTRTPAKTNVRSNTSRTTTNSQHQNVVARATAQQATLVETRTGAEYEQCKTAFFTCMDQFCALKNDNFKRCSCSDRIFKLQDIYETYQKVGENLSEFTENLDIVGMTYDQAIAMKTASEGEEALIDDRSASKQLLQAIMNAIKGEDSSVGGKYKDLNSITISSDISNAFGLDNSGQIIASYNGTTLYKNVFQTCKNLVQEDCNKSSLQRAINAYLMAIEQDCNTVETALKTQQKNLKASTHESSALLDLARVENRQKHNSDDIATCIANIESAITDDNVCGENYHKCLDYGQFINVSTGAPLTGVADFYQLGKLLTFRTSENLENQKLSSIQENRKFVQFFENKTKKFAQLALDKCVENADTAWQEYLDMALLDIYYAQQDKVDSVEKNCFELVTACYEGQNTAITSALANLTDDTLILLKPATINLTDQLCSDYIDSCNNMFSGNVVKAYLANKKSTDSETACRAIAQQCFDKFGGTGYENFYSPQSGLFTIGEALDWFSLYDAKNNIVSPCAQELASTEGCGDKDLLEKVFGGFDKKTIENSSTPIYTTSDISDNNYEDRRIRSRGVASEVYTKIINNLSNQCESINGFFVEHQHAKRYDYDPNNACQIDTSSMYSIFYRNTLANSERYLHYWYNFIPNENMCPANYIANVDVQSWGACSCWENGGYRSKNGITTTCRPLLPVANISTDGSDPSCTAEMLSEPLSSIPTENQWCQQSVMSSLSQLCPRMNVLKSSSYTLCAYKDGSSDLRLIEPVLEYVRQPKATETEISNSNVEGWNYIQFEHNLPQEL